MNVIGYSLIIAVSLTLVSCGPAAEPQPGAQAAAMTTVPDDMFGPADKAELSRLVTRIADGSGAFAGLPDPKLASCADAQNERYCEYEQLKFLNEWKAAHAGTYQAQRDVAFCLTQQCEGVVQDKVKGCAWRAVIVATGKDEVTDLDAANFKTDCGLLQEADRAIAMAQADDIARLIAGAAAA